MPGTFINTKVNTITPALFQLGANLNQIPAILNDGNTVARYDRNDPNGVLLDDSGNDMVYWDLMVGNEQRGEEETSGTTVAYGVYEITATATNYWFTGCQVGDFYVAVTGRVISSTNSVKRVLGNHLCQPVESKRPIAGVFDGVDNFMKTASFVYNQPEQVYFVGKQKTWSDFSIVMDGDNYERGAVWQRNTSPNFRITAGSAIVVTGPEIDTAFIATILFNGASSEIIINEDTPVTGDLGLNNMGGFTVGASGAGTARFSNIEFESTVLRKIADTTASKSEIYNWLKKKLV